MYILVFMSSYTSTVIFGQYLDMCSFGQILLMCVLINESRTKERGIGFAYAFNSDVLNRSGTRFNVRKQEKANS